MAAISPANISREERREVSDQSRWGPRGEGFGNGSRSCILVLDVPDTMWPYIVTSFGASVSPSVINPVQKVFVRFWGGGYWCQPTLGTLK